MKSIIFLIVLFVCAQASAEFYKWTDDSGVVHFGQDPPQETEVPIEEQAEIYKKELTFHSKIRDKYLMEHKDLPPRIRNAIMSGDLVMGMTSEQVLMSMDYPLRVSKINGDMAEKWSYSKGNAYIKNGILVSWQQGK